MTLNICNFFFFLELFLAENVVMFSYPKRKKFVLKMILSFLFVGLFAIAFPDTDKMFNIPALNLVRYITIFMLSFASMAVIYDVNENICFSGCVQGFAILYASGHIICLIAMTPIFEGYNFDYLTKNVVLEAVFFPLIFGLIGIVLGILSKKTRYYEHSNSITNIFGCVVLTLVIILTLSSRYLMIDDTPITHLYAIICCALIIIIEVSYGLFVKTETDNKILETLMKENKKQYKISRDSIELINVKYHDIKKRLESIKDNISEEEFKSLNNAMKSANSIFNSKNETLDILLGQKAAICNKYNIKLIYIGDASSLDFMKESDIYFLFSNALDNAIEAAKEVIENKKMISIKVEPMGDLVNISLLNYFSTKPITKNGKLLTSKLDNPDFHGYGFKSIQTVSKKYNGDASFEIDDDIFKLNVFVIKN